MIETPMAGIDDLEDVSPHCRQINYVSVGMTTNEARTLCQILAVYYVRGQDDEVHLSHVGNALRKLRLALGWERCDGQR